MMRVSKVSALALLALTACAPAPQRSADDNQLQPYGGAEGVAVFDRVCLQNYPSFAGVEASAISEGFNGFVDLGDGVESAVSGIRPNTFINLIDDGGDGRSICSLTFQSADGGATIDMSLSELAVKRRTGVFDFAGATDGNIRSLTVPPSVSAQPLFQLNIRQP